MRRRRHLREQESGAAAVELALVMPLLMMVLFGAIAFGIVLAQQLALGNAARQAARYAVVADRTCAQITSEARAAAQTIMMEGRATTVGVTVGPSEAAAIPACGTDAAVPCANSRVGDNVYVTVGYRSRLVVPLVIDNPTFDLDGTGTFRCEFS